LLQKTGRGKVSPAADIFLQAERNSVLHDERFLNGWRQKIEDTMSVFRDLLRSRIERGQTIVGYGAPTKATLLMKMAGIDEDDIAYIVEDNPHKCGKFLPGSGIPIKPISELSNAPFDVLVIFAWNFSDDIIGKLAGKFSRSVEVLIPLPELKIHPL
jgi:hypothetical protein